VRKFYPASRNSPGEGPIELLALISIRFLEIRFLELNPRMTKMA